MTDYKQKLDLKPEDIHMIVSHAWRTLKCYTGDGRLIFATDALTDGTGDYDNTGRQDLPSSDTPFGTYRFTGEIIQTRASDSWGTWASYGPWFLGLYDVDGQERSLGRSGIGMHGGRQGKYAPDPSQRRLLYPTHGCIRVYDDVLEGKILPTVRRALRDGKAFVTVVP